MDKIVILFLLFSCQLSHGFQRSFYILRNTSPTNKMHEQSRSIDYLIAQAYHINEYGDVSGYINRKTLEFSEQYQVKLIALVTNSLFDGTKAHRFLTSAAAQRKTIATLIQIAKTNKLYGFQFDFEGISIGDERALTLFYRNAANKLHEHGYSVSFAVIPSFPDISQHTDYQKRKYHNWSGVYNLKKLSEFADFISVMTYDQHQPGTTPGPSAGLQWVEAALRYALQYVPKNKLSLGIPTYSTYWHLGSSANHHRVYVKEEDVHYQKAMALIRKFHVPLIWDKRNYVNYAIWEKNWMNEYMFIENARSFTAKLSLAKRYGLQGISVFDLGYEDPAIWGLISTEST